MESTSEFVKNFNETKKKQERNKRRRGYDDPEKRLPNKKHS